MLKAKDMTLKDKAKDLKTKARPRPTGQGLGEMFPRIFEAKDMSSRSTRLSITRQIMVYLHWNTRYVCAA